VGRYRSPITGPRGEEEVAARGRVDTDEFAFVRWMVLAGFGIALAPLTLFRALVRGHGTAISDGRHAPASAGCA
jgi:DNA-binding transcriptional LysR family regulator